MRNPIIIMIFGLVIAALSCEQSRIVEPQIDGRLITKDKAIEISKKFLLEQNKNSRLSRVARFQVNEIKGSHGKTALFIVNNDLGGWQVVAGTDVRHPILAYSSSSYFDIDIDKMNDGLKGWIGSSIASMVFAYNNLEEYEVQFVGQSNVAGRANIGKDPPPEPCEEYHSIFGPFIEDANGDEPGFRQDWPENMHMKTCTNQTEDYNGHAPVGCVPVAMAMVMWHYQLPNTYTWASIPTVPVFDTGSSGQKLRLGHYLETSGMSFNHTILHF